MLHFRSGRLTSSLVAPGYARPTPTTRLAYLIWRMRLGRRLPCDVAASSAMDAAPYPSQGFVSVAVTASLGAVLAIGDGIVPINDSMASIRGPRIWKRGLWSRAGRATVSRSNVGSATIRGQTFRPSPQVALDLRKHSDAPRGLIGAWVRASQESEEVIPNSKRGPEWELCDPRHD